MNRFNHKSAFIAPAEICSKQALCWTGREYCQKQELENDEHGVILLCMNGRLLIVQDKIRKVHLRCHAAIARSPPLP